MWKKENGTVLFVLTGKYQVKDVKRLIIVKCALISLQCILGNASKFIILYESI